MKKQGQNKPGEPRKGALVAALVVVFVTICVAASYFLFTPAHKTDKSAAKKTEAPLIITKIQPNTPDPPVTAPPVVEKKPTKDKVHPEAGSTTPDETAALNNKSGTGRLAIIIDDMGSSVAEARSLAAIGVTLNFSVIPGLRNYREVTMFAESQGIETMIHIPMQSKGWPERRLEANGLLVSMDDAELRERVGGFLRDIPGAIGVNNHMGSEFMEHEDKVRSVLETLKSKNLFFVDSVTSAQTTGTRLARAMGIKSGRRNVFLDNEQERGYILGQLGQAVRLAKKNGSAIAICHPHPQTIAALASALPSLSSQGISLVPVSQVVR